MKQIKITIGGVEYPYQETCGALLAFKRETGLDITQVAPDDTENNMRYMHQVVKHTCKLTGQEFNMSFEEFVDKFHSLEYSQLLIDIQEQVAEFKETNDKSKKK